VPPEVAVVHLEGEVPGLWGAPWRQKTRMGGTHTSSLLQQGAPWAWNRPLQVNHASFLEHPYEFPEHPYELPEHPYEFSADPIEFCGRPY
jgi:hypothetical protein